MEWNNLQAVLNDFGRDFMNLVADKIVEADGVATGEMLNTLDFEVRQAGSYFAVYLKHTDYFTYFDKGTRPHWPPRSAIEKWVQDKPVLPYPDKNGKLPTVEQLAFLISREISENGTEARDVFEKAKAELFPKYEQLINEAVEKDVMADFLAGGPLNGLHILKFK